MKILDGISHSDDKEIKVVDRLLSFNITTFAKRNKIIV